MPTNDIRSCGRGIWSSVTDNHVKHQRRRQVNIPGQVENRSGCLRILLFKRSRYSIQQPPQTVELFR